MNNQSSNLPKILSEQSINNINLLKETINFSGDLPYWTFSTDTRDIAEDGWFVALSGKNFDGHEFVEQALALGAKGLILSKLPNNLTTAVPIILVENTLAAYQTIARQHKRNLQLQTIAITGSNGKTSTKEMLVNVLSKKFAVVATHANENNEIGVPKTIFKANTQTEVLILECGMRGLGQIEELTKIAEPDISAITCIGTAHIGLLSSKEKIAEAKSEIFRFMPKDKTAFVPFNEPLLDSWLKLVEGNIQINYFGDFSGAAFKEDKMHFLYKNEGFYLHSPNLALVSNACLVIDLARKLGLSHSEIQQGLASFKPVNGRGLTKILKSGATIIDETYNANPDSVVALARSLQCLANGRSKILVLGEMAELGDLKNDLVDQMARLIESLVDEVILIGEENKELTNKLGHKSFCFATLEKAFEHFTRQPEKYLHSNTLLGIKASRASKLEKLIEMLENA